MTCTSCRYRPPEPGKGRCLRCIDRDHQYAVTRYRERREQGLCGRCDDPAVPGKSRCTRHLG